MPEQAVIILVMGVSGSGKSTVGGLLAERLGWHFIEGDRFHPRENIEKMRRGQPLTDEDRAPWLEALREAIERTIVGRTNAVLACSALKRAYRERLTRGHEGEFAVVHLHADAATIRARMERREHSMKPAMLDSQLATLEPPGPDEAITVDVTQPPEEAVAEIWRRLGV